MVDEGRYQIPVKHRVVMLVWSSDLDDYINELFPGRRWSFSALHGEAHNGSYHEISVDWSDYDFTELDAEMDRWLESSPPEKSWENDIPNMSLEDFFNVLSKRNMWPNGDFAVHVWW